MVGGAADAGALFQRCHYTNMCIPCNISSKTSCSMGICRTVGSTARLQERPSGRGRPAAPARRRHRQALGSPSRAALTIAPAAMSARKRQRRVIDDDSEHELADVGLATAPARLGRLRRARNDMSAAAEEVIDLCDEPEPGSAARAPPPPPPPGELVTPQPARQPEAPTTQRRSGLRDRVPSSKKAQQRAALARLHRQRSGAGALGEACSGWEAC